MQNDDYGFPHVLVCVFGGNGCGYSDAEKAACIASAFEYSDVFFDGDNYTEHVVASEVTVWQVSRACCFKCEEEAACVLIAPGNICLRRAAGGEERRFRRSRNKPE